MRDTDRSGKATCGEIVSHQSAGENRQILRFTPFRPIGHRAYRPFGGRKIRKNKKVSVTVKVCQQVSPMDWIRTFSRSENAWFSVEKCLSGKKPCVAPLCCSSAFWPLLLPVAVSPFPVVAAPASPPPLPGPQSLIPKPAIVEPGKTERRPCSVALVAANRPACRVVRVRFLRATHGGHTRFPG